MPWRYDCSRPCARQKETPPLPIKAHSERLNSLDRGLSLAMLRALRAFYDEHGALEKVMGDVYKEEGFGESVVALTRSTGLSLAESLVHVAKGDARASSSSAARRPSSPTRGRARSLRDQLWAVEQKLLELEAEDGVTRYVWIDMFAASQNLLAGVFKDEAITKETDPAGYKARKEDTDNIFGDALKAVDELLLYSEPAHGGVDGAAARVPAVRRPRRAARGVGAARSGRDHARVVPL